MPFPIRDMTDEEIAVVDAFGEAGNLFGQLPEVHPCDLEEMITHLHAIQNIVYSRPAFEGYKREFDYNPFQESQ